MPKHLKNIVRQLPSTPPPVSCVWEVLFESVEPYAAIVLTHRLRLTDGSRPQFDEQNLCPPDAEAGDDDHMMMEAFLALIPSDTLVSCAMRATRRHLLLFEQDYYQHTFAEYDKDSVAVTFKGALWNSGGEADFVFVGGTIEAHSSEQITHWAERIQHLLKHYEEESWAAMIEELMATYDQLLFTLVSQIYVLLHAPALNNQRVALIDIATRYGLVLPPEELPT